MALPQLSNCEYPSTRGDALSICSLRLLTKLVFVLSALPETSEEITPAGFLPFYFAFASETFWRNRVLCPRQNKIARKKRSSFVRQEEIERTVQERGSSHGAFIFYYARTRLLAP
jgi:hypothetical protein